MDYQSKSHVVTLANSIIGVSVLAMPYCFKQCGIILAIVMLIISSLISRVACHFLLKSAITARRRTFEYLAFYIFGKFGKFLVEVGIIGFLIGTCIAFFVVIGDLGPEIISEIAGTHTSSTMRTSIMMALALFCVLPLGLLRNVDSLVGVSKATIGFYVCLVLKIIAEAIPYIFSGDWYNNVLLWKPAGIIQCLPIFSMALSCQTQLFEIYQVLHNPTLDKMNHLVYIAVNICTLVYIFVGIFGYIAFFNKPFTGNILLSFSSSIVTDVIKIGFVLSLAFSFPLVIFPCRASLYSLLYREGFSLHEGISNYIPEGKFKGITLFIVFVSLIFGILMPNIELVLGLVGSTIGIAICILFPVTCFIYISEKNTNERILAKIILFVGIIIMILGTYENLQNLEKLESPTVNSEMTEKILLPGKHVLVTSKQKLVTAEVIVKPSAGADVKHEPPFPIESKEVDKKLVDIVKQLSETEILKLNPQVVQMNSPLGSKEKLEEKPPQIPVLQSQQQQVVKPQENKPQDNIGLEKKNKAEQSNISEENELNNESNLDIRHEPVAPIEPQENDVPNVPMKPNKLENTKTEQHLPQNLSKSFKPGILNAKDKPETALDSIGQPEAKKLLLNDSVNVNNEIDVEAIKKEDKESKIQETETIRNIEHDKSHQILIDTLQKQSEYQKEIVEQQKKLIEVIESQQKELIKKEVKDKVNEEKLKAVKQIETIALKAIEQISGKDDKNIVEETKQNIKEKLAESVNVDSGKNNIGSKEVVNQNLNVINEIDKSEVLNKVDQERMSENIKAPINNSFTIKNNTAPLFLNLGQKNSSLSAENFAKKPNLTLPLVLFNNINNSTFKKRLENTELFKNLTARNNSTDLKKEVTVKETHELQDHVNIKDMRRDILSYTGKLVN